jgi:leader peptidase (prepilin peptidase)/N-methyltransferase
MDPLLYIVPFVFGAAIGSFLNVCIYRIPSGESLIRPGSRCPKCKTPIAWHDNVPILSFIFLGGRCRHCNEKISFRYPLVEALSGIVCAILFSDYGISIEFFLYYIMSCALLVVSFIDLDHQIIPNCITYPGIAAGLLASVALPNRTPWESLFGAALGAGSLLLVAMAFRAIRGKEGMGMGDVKLLAMIGAFLGWKGVVFTLVLSSFLGSAIGIIALKASGKDAGQPIPYGPFLSLGALFFVLGGDRWLDWYLHLGRVF